MLVSSTRYLAAGATAIVLLTSCAGGSSTPPLKSTATAPFAAPAGNRHRLYVAIPYSPTYTQGAIGVFGLTRFGDVAPVQEIGGAATGLNTPSDVALDASRNMFVANFGNNTVTVYAAGATGNVAPTATIAGSNTGLASPFGIAIDRATQDIYVSNKFGGSGGGGSITIYSHGANGNVTPTATIAGSNTQLNEPLSLALDASGNIYVPNLLPLGAGSITVYAAGSTGNVAPITTISGSNTLLNGPYQVAVDSSLNIYVANFWPPYGITVYAAGANGNVAPTKTITGPATKMDSPDGVALDAAKNVYVANYDANDIGIFAATAQGNVAPAHQIKGKKTGVICPSGMVIF